MSVVATLKMNQNNDNRIFSLEDLKNLLEDPAEISGESDISEEQVHQFQGTKLGRLVNESWQEHSFTGDTASTTTVSAPELDSSNNERSLKSLFARFWSNPALLAVPACFVFALAFALFGLSNKDLRCASTNEYEVLGCGGDNYTAFLVDSYPRDNVERSVSIRPLVRPASSIFERGGIAEIVLTPDIQQELASVFNSVDATWVVYSYLNDAPLKEAPDTFLVVEVTEKNSLELMRKLESASPQLLSLIDANGLEFSESGIARFVVLVDRLE